MEKTVVFSNIFLAIFLIVIMNGCSFLLSPLNIRQNPNDERAQINQVKIAQTAPDTVTANVVIRDPMHYFDDEENIEEVLLAYNLDTPPPSRMMFYPPEQGGTKNFKKEFGVVSYSWDIEGFEVDDEVWLAAYPKTEQKWHSAIYDKVTVKDITGTGGLVSIENVLIKNMYYADAFDAGGGERLGVFEVSGVTRPVEIVNDTEESNLILRFYLGNEITTCNSALLSIEPTSSGSGANCVIFPMMNNVSTGEGSTVAENALLSRDGANATTLGNTFNAGINNVDITAEVNFAISYGSNAIAIGSNSNITEEITPGSDIKLSISYYE